MGNGRAPHGARGLKRLYSNYVLHYTQSRPARGAWIETLKCMPSILYPKVAPRTGRVD